MYQCVLGDGDDNNNQCKCQQASAGVFEDDELGASILCCVYSVKC